MYQSYSVMIWPVIYSCTDTVRYYTHIHEIQTPDVDNPLWDILSTTTSWHSLRCGIWHNSLLDLRTSNSIQFNSNLFIFNRIYRINFHSIVCWKQHHQCPLKVYQMNSEVSNSLLLHNFRSMYTNDVIGSAGDYFHSL